MKPNRLAIIDPETLDLKTGDEPKLKQRLNSVLKKLDKELVLRSPVTIPEAKTSYTDKELLDFLETQLVKGMCWVPIWLDRSHAIVTIARVGYVPIPYPTFRDAVADALDANKTILKERGELMETALPKLKGKYVI